MSEDEGQVRVRVPLGYSVEWKDVDNPADSINDEAGRLQHVLGEFHSIYSHTLRMSERVVGVMIITHHHADDREPDVQIVSGKVADPTDGHCGDSMRLNEGQWLRIEEDRDGIALVFMAEGG